MKILDSAKEKIFQPHAETFAARKFFNRTPRLLPLENFSAARRDFCRSKIFQPHAAA